MFTLLLFAAIAVSPSSYEWRPFNDGTGDYSLRNPTRQVGYYRVATDSYYPLDPVTDKFGPKCEPPCPPPFRNFGVTLSGNPTGTHYRHNGAEISAAEADTLLSVPTSTSPADTDGRKWVVVIGPEAVTAPIVALCDGAKAKGELDTRLVVKAYLPDDWQVKNSGYMTAGNPTIYLLDSGGKVLYRREDAAWDKEELLAALREADPDYEPANDPGPGNAGSPFFDPAILGLAGACLLFVVAFIVFVWGYQKWRISSPSLSR